MAFLKAPMPANRIKLTRSFVDTLQPEGRQTIFWDTELRGFGVCVNTSCKTYLVQRTIGSRVNGNRRTAKVVIGRHGVILPDEARRRARELLAQFARGEDPRVARRAAAAKSITLRQAWEQYKLARPLGAQAVRDYGRAVEKHLSRWLDRPISQITGTEVVQLYSEISDPNRLGPSVAAKTMRIFRAIYNFAEIANEDLPPNPAGRLTKLRMWHRDRRRTGYIQPAQLAAWHNAAMQLPSQAARDYLRLVLFTGMRRSEAAGLKWENIDFSRKILMVPITKNGDPLVLPMSSYVHDLLHARRQTVGDSEYVFPAESARGFLQEPKKWVAEVARKSGVHVTLHDLRRTFATIAESLNIGQRTIQRLLNHRPGREALTNYVVLGVEQLRDPMERVSSFIQRAAHGQSSVMPIRQPRSKS
jgi:integrase